MTIIEVSLSLLSSIDALDSYISAVEVKSDWSAAVESKVGVIYEAELSNCRTCRR